MVGFVIRHVELEQMEALIERPDQTHPPGQGMKQSDSTAGDGVCFIGDVVVNVGGREAGLKGNRIACLVESACHPRLAFGEPTTENGIHLKSFCGRGGWKAANSSNTAKHRRISRISSFSIFSNGCNPEPRFFKG
jgi:hypothetical protein